MPDALVVVVPALLAGVLLLSGFGKLGDRDPLTAWNEMHVPDALRRPSLAAAHPYAEILLGAALLLTGGTVHVVASLLVLALMLAYAALVHGALRRPDAVACSCFGARRSAPVTRTTWWRNVWLSGLALLGVVVALADPRPPLSAATAPGAGWWLVGAAATAVTAALVVSTHGSEAVDPTHEESAAADGEDELDFLRTRTPDVPVTLADGSTATLRGLSSERALLLLEVSESCGGCVEVIRSVPAWREDLPEIDVRLLLTVPADDSTLASTDEPQSVHDTPFHVSRSFGYGATPTAVLLGADGLLAGGPVTGDAAIRDFVAQVDAELHGSPDESSAVHAHEPR